MWSLKNTYILIHVYCWTFVRADNKCDHKFRIPNWEPPQSKPPGYLRQGLPQEWKLGLEALVENRTEDLNLTLYANPFIKNGICPSADNRYQDLRRFHEPRPVYQGGNESNSIFFGNIFTGCYYFEMENAAGKKWLWDPKFYETDYHFHDTALKCIKSRFKPENHNQPRELTLELEVPLTCLTLSCQLYELVGITNSTIHDLDTGHIRPKQDCSVKYTDVGRQPEVVCTNKDTGIMLKPDNIVESNGREGWKIIITWHNLTKGGAYYYSMFRNQLSENCYKCNISYGDLMTWHPVVVVGAIIHEYQNTTNYPEEIVQTDFFHNSIFMSICYSALGVILLAVLIYWMRKYAIFILRRKHETVNWIVKSHETLQLHNEKKYNRILLIYAMDSPSFMNQMDTFKNQLQQTCGSPIHDLYSIKDWKMIAKLGACRWIEQLLKDGCKIVWVDTPQFRSRLKNYESKKDQQEHYDATDFRDPAIPYAVALAKDLFQEATTQYCRHFVVRLEGLEVEDGQDDPLLVVSPHARYYIPEQLFLLCEHLTR